ncbi:ScyD/ScyE family protein [Cellulomonas endophytica]|uniref:ScyD/ScyE family protein n=1 Tax=Cellulomonas endophytica TaxID=2494735 RepID=UPI001012B620|nr:ScyD/ScyE family protein [Cellulomonas endophytica]
MPRTRSSTHLLSAALATGLVVATAGAAQAAPGDEPLLLADGLVGPLSVAVDGSGGAVVAQSFGDRLSWARQGVVTRIGGTVAPGTELAALSFSDDGRLTYAESTMEGGALIKERNVFGGTKVVVDLAAAEAELNPDGEQSYGLLDLDEECAAQVPPGVPVVPYTGETYSHPYATARVGDTLYVADAGGNAIWQVVDGEATPLVVLPPQTATFPDEVYAEAGLPECTFGLEFSAEPVPTDVEVGPDGWLYVTTLPGGPEDPTAGPRGSLWRVDPADGTVEPIATGFLGATGLAVSDTGDVYVAELLGGRVSKVPAGSSTPEVFVEAPLPAAVEIGDEGLYVTWDVLPGEGTPPDGKLSLFPW